MARIRSLLPFAALATFVVLILAIPVVAADGASRTATPAKSSGTTGSTGTTGVTTPPAKQVAAALKRAESSTGLWATVNICNTKAHPNTVGVRAQMPSLGFPATQQMKVTLGYYTTSTGNFTPLAKSAVPLHLGLQSTGYHQDGVTFTVKPPAVLDATVQFTWSEGTKILGQKTISTTAGHKGVQQSDPKNYSAAQCRIG